MSSLIDKSRSRLPAEALALLLKIKNVIEGLAPKMFDGSLPMEHSALMSNAVTRDLPTTVGNYLRLPSAFANLHALDGGKTCKAMLMEQLTLLEKQLSMMEKGAYQNDAEAVKINGLLLREKFKPVSFVD